MALYDWNHNGRKDIQDDYLEYNIYKKCTEDNQSSVGSSGGDTGCGLWFLIVVILIIIGMFSR